MIFFAPRIQNDQGNGLSWRETRITPNDHPFNMRRTSVWVLVKVYLRRENFRFCFYTRGTFFSFFAHSFLKMDHLCAFAPLRQNNPLNSNYFFAI
jgi:hypothetical protein